MTLVFDRLNYPNRAEPWADRTVSVRLPTDVLVPAERREITGLSRTKTDANGVFTFDLDPLPDGYYYILNMPDNDERIIVMPTSEPPHDSQHLIPGSDPVAYGWWVNEIEIADPITMPDFEVGVVTISGPGVDTTDPRHPIVNLPLSSVYLDRTTNIWPPRPPGADMVIWVGGIDTYPPPEMVPFKDIWVRDA